MNTEKIRAYNQKILALLGTIACVILTIGLIMLLSFAIPELFRGFRSNTNDSGILSDDQVEALQKENKRQQVVSFELPQLVDSLNLIYMIPVSHKTLNEPEYIEEGALNLMDTYGEVRTREKRFSKRFYGSFHNLIIYEEAKQKVKQLFDKRVNFADLRTEYFQDDILILFKASDEDTYKDGVINLQDYKSLYLYSVKRKELKEIQMDHADVFSYSFIPDTKDIMVQIGLDHNGDGKYDAYNEPSIVRKFDFESGVLIDMIDDKMKDILQKRLEGTEK